MQPFGFGAVLLRLGDRRELAQDLRAHPDRRSDAAAAHRGELAERLVERRRRAVGLVLQAQDRAAQIFGLAVEDLRPVFGQQARADRVELVRNRRFRIEPRRGLGVDRQIAYRGVDRGAAIGVGQRLVELGERRIGTLLVHQVHRAIVAQHADHHRIAAGHRLGAREQAVGLAIAAEVRLLQRLVGDRLGLVHAARIARCERAEKFGGFGIGAAIVAAIGLGERAARIEAARLRARERGGVAGIGGRDRDLARDDLVGDDRAQAEPQRRIIAGKALGGVKRVLLAPQIDAIFDVDVLLAADHALDLAERVDRLAARGRAFDLVGAERGEPRGGVAAAIAQRVEPADRHRRVAADDRIGAVEHVLERGIGGAGLRRAEHARARSEPEAVLQADRLRVGGRRRQRQPRARRRRTGGP